LLNDGGILSKLAGQLYIVATPIGNLTDMTDRARDILSTVDVILCEDTRHSRRLLNHFHITTPVQAYHEHNEAQIAPILLQQLHDGSSLALISDAGTPLINDPGFILVRAAREQGLTVTPIPGVSALICALSAAGLPTDRFLFLGFIPRGESKQHAWANLLRTEPGTLVCYESAQRIVTTLARLARIFEPTRQAVIARELTKQFETFIGGTLEELAIKCAQDKQQQRGEIVLLIAGAQPQQLSQDESDTKIQHTLAVLLAELPPRQAARLASQLCNKTSNELYQQALALKGH
jgi:16S rRNA (cytidine1402-2'-O)-methyltransferase